MLLHKGGQEVFRWLPSQLTKPITIYPRPGVRIDQVPCNAFIYIYLYLHLYLYLYLYLQLSLPLHICICILILAVKALYGMSSKSNEFMFFKVAVEQNCHLILLLYRN